MAQKEFKDLPLDTLLTGTEIIPLQEPAGGPGSTKETPLDDLAAFVLGERPLGLPTKASPVSGDRCVILDSASGDAPKLALLGAFPGAGGGGGYQPTVDLIVDPDATPDPGKIFDDLDDLSTYINATGGNFRVRLNGKGPIPGTLAIQADTAAIAVEIVGTGGGTASAGPGMLATVPNYVSGVSANGGGYGVKLFLRNLTCSGGVSVVGDVNLLTDGLSVGGPIVFGLNSYGGVLKNTGGRDYSGTVPFWIFVDNSATSFGLIMDDCEFHFSGGSSAGIVYFVNDVVQYLALNKCRLYREDGDEIVSQASTIISLNNIPTNVRISAGTITRSPEQLGTKVVDETAIADGKVPAYQASGDALVYKTPGDLPFTPANSGDWSGLPATLQAAIDRLAAAVVALQSGDPIL